MSLLNAASTIPRAAVVYVTIGALTVVWSAIWYVYVLNNNLASGATTLYWCYGFMITGLTLMLIGLTIGWFARVRLPGSEMLREEVASAVAQAGQIAPAPAPILAIAIPSPVPVAIGTNNGIPVTVRPAYQAELRENAESASGQPQFLKRVP